MPQDGGPTWACIDAGGEITCVLAGLMDMGAVVERPHQAGDGSLDGVHRPVAGLRRREPSKARDRRRG